MDSLRRRQYLKRLGLEVWRERGATPTAAAGQEAVAPVPAVEAPPMRRARATEQEVIAAAPGHATGAEPPKRPTAKAAPTPVAAHAVAERPPVPADWEGLRAAVRDCQVCKLCSTRTQTVFGVGHASAQLMIVGEGPGADEDVRGEPFVGRAGKLLDEMLKAIGRSRADTESGGSVFIANVVKCRPPGNRDPEADEVEACRPYLDRQIELVRPKLIVALGRVAAQRLLGSNEPLSRLRGPIHSYGPTQTPLFITYHPAYLLRSPREKAKSWEDLKKVWSFLKDVS